MTRIGGDGPRLHRTGGSERSSEAKKTEPASRKSEAKARAGVQKSDSFSEAAGAKAFPRASWGDVKQMRRALKKAKSKSDKIQKKPHPRTSPRKPKPSVGEGPPIAMRYGLRPPSGGGDVVTPDAPPIAMRYGLRPPSGGGGDVVIPDSPPIAMRYGLRPPSGGGDVVIPDSPPIAMRYGLRPPSGGGGGADVTPDAPPIAMRYGLRPPAAGN